MLAHLIRIAQPPVEKLTAQTLYVALVEQARRPVFYAQCGVPDTLDGRFELIVLHMFLVLQRLKTEAGTAPLQRALMEAFFEDMDRSVRELGVSDTGVGKRVKRMASAFYGRTKAYETALASGLEEALRRNLYGTTTATPQLLEKMAGYIAASLAQLQKLPLGALEQGRLAFANPK